MKEYCVETIGLVLKSKNSFKETFQELINKKAAEGYTLHSFSMHYEFCVAVFERENNPEKDI